MTLSNRLSERVRSGDPVALATVIEGEGVGNHLLIIPGEESDGSLGHPDLDRVVHRDGLAELEAGRSGIRTYGPEGQTTPKIWREPPPSGCSLRAGRHHHKCGYLGLLISPPLWLGSQRFLATEFLSVMLGRSLRRAADFQWLTRFGLPGRVRYSMSVARPSGREMRSAFLPTIPNLMSRRCRVRLLPVLATSESWAVAPLMNVGLNDLLRPGSHRIMTLSG